MTNMITFCNTMLDSLAEFLTATPVFYLFSLVCFCFIAKFIKILVGRRYV